MEIVLATGNKKKVDEIRRISEGLGIVLLTLDDFPGCPEVVEDGKTFEDNAIKKAIAVCRYSGRPALADDSGLEVDALHGSPGTFSARYAGKDADDRKNYEKLLKEMRGMTDRKARFVCWIALALPDGTVHTFSGFAEGSIGTEHRGSHGFGYDPVFYPYGYKKTFAEMEDHQKDSLSHRRKALEKFIEYIKHKLN